MARMRNRVKRTRSSAHTYQAQRAPSESRKKLTGTGFWVFLILALFKDSLDGILHAVNYGLLGASIGSGGLLAVPLGIAIAVIFVTVFVMSVLLYAAIIVYLRANGVKFTTSRVILTAVTFFIEISPGGFLPVTTLWLVGIRLFENNNVGAFIPGGRLLRAGRKLGRS